MKPRSPQTSSQILLHKVITATVTPPHTVILDTVMLETTQPMILETTQPEEGYITEFSPVSACKIFVIIKALSTN